jgi:integrase
MQIASLPQALPSPCQDKKPSLPKKLKPQPAAKVKRGSVEILIFQVLKRVGESKYTQFEFTYYPHAGADRERVRRADLEDAKREAEVVATKLSNGEGEVLKLTTSDRAVYLQSLDSLRALPAPKPLNLFVAEAVAATLRLPENMTIGEAVELARRRSPAGFAQRTVRQVVDELVAAKDGRSTGDIKDLQGRGGRFADNFQMPIAQVTGSMIEDYLDELDLEPRTLKNHFGVITRIFRFAVRRKYLPKDSLDELEIIELPDAPDGEIAIYSPSEMAEILSSARPEIVPWICTAGFSGIRSAEIQRLDWSNVNFVERHIEVPAKKAKTKSRRLAPLPENSTQWLQPYRKPQGRLAVFDNMAKQILKLVGEINARRQQIAAKEGTAFKEFKWRRNGLRHSFVSYRIAEIKDAAQVAIEAGNSPDIIFRNYRKVVSEAEAAKWFAIAPLLQENVLMLSPSASIPGSH